MDDSRKQVYCLSNPIELRFKEEQPPHPPQIPLSPRSPKAVISNLFSLVTRRKDRFAFPDIPASEKAVRLKFVDKLTNDCIVVGNHRELDILGLTLVREEFTMDTRLVGRIMPTFDMHFMRIQRKRNLVVVAGPHYLTIFEVNLKVDSIKSWTSVYFDSPIVGVEVLNETTLYIFHEETVEVVSIENNQLTVRQQLPYNKPEPGLHVLAVPKLADKSAFIFFYRPEELDSETGMFSLYKCLLSNDNSEFKLSPITNVYKLDTGYFKNMQLLVYDRETFLINLVTQVLVIKKHYPIDVGELKHRNENSRLIYLENGNLLHVCDSRAELHTLSVRSNSISIKSFDCIKLVKPEDSNFMTAIDLDGDRVLLVYSKAENMSMRETKYWLMVTLESTVKNKLKELLVDTNNLRDIQDVAEKMGMMKKEIFLELWCQSNKRTKNDFDILLETEDYKTIISQLKMALRKNSVSFREIERIERQCLLLLEKKIAVEPTEYNLRRYIKSHFMLRKYGVIKNIQGKKRMSIAPSAQEEESKMMLSIQDLQDIRKRNIQTYIVELMRDIVQEPGKASLHETLNAYVEGFKFVLRRIFPEFLSDVISNLGEDLLMLLQEYPQLLPMQNAEGKYLGVWADIPAAEWDKHIYYEKLHTVDNAAALNAMMKKDWFRWDWLIKHDLLQLKRHEFEKEFVSSRQCTIYYRLLDLLFNIIKEHDKRQPIVQFIEENYTIPEHLPGRIDLYWELHCFFQLPDKLPGYHMRFEELLPLHEEDIFRMVFSHPKNCKRLVLTDIKDIYRATTPVGFYEAGILSYFRSDYSSIADLKYLLNRINNQKIEFHEENQSLYGVLVEAVFLKLAWHGSDPVPIRDVLVYFESIPLSEDELIKLQLIERLNRSANLFYEIGLNMSLRKFFDSGEEVMCKLAQIYIQKVIPSSGTGRSNAGDSPSIFFSDILEIMLAVRQDLFESLKDLKVLEIIISQAMNFDDLISDVETLIFNDRLLQKYDVHDPQEFLECIVSEKIDKSFETDPKFSHHEIFINSLLKLLPKNTPRKKALQSHLQLGLMLEKLDHPAQAPLIISSRFIEQTLFKQKCSSVRKLDIDKVYDHMLAMGTREPKSALYEKLILKFLEDGEWKDAVAYTKLWNETSNSNVFAALIALKVGEELSKDLKENLLDIVILYLWRPKDLLELIEQIIQTDDSKVLKQLISQVLFENDLRPEDYYERNALLSPLFKKLEMPANLKLIKDFYRELRRSDIELQRNETYYLYYRMLLCEPERAHELHEKYFDWIDVRRIEYLVREMSRNKSNMFNPLEVLLFAFKSLLALFSLNYLSKEFDSLSELFAMSYAELIEKHGELIQELDEEMKTIDVTDNLTVMHNIERIYKRKREREVTGDNMSMEVESEEEEETSRNEEFLRSKPFNRGAAAKRTIIPPVKVSENTVGESNNLVWKNMVEQQSNSLRMTASIRRKDSKKEEHYNKNFRNTMKGLDRGKIAGALAADSTAPQDSPSHSARKNRPGFDERSKKSIGDVPDNLRSDRQTFCEVVEENVGMEDEKKSPEVSPTRLHKKSSQKTAGKQIYFGSRENLSRSEMPTSIKELVKNEMAHLFAEELQIGSKKKQEEPTPSLTAPALHVPELPLPGGKSTKAVLPKESTETVPVVTFRAEQPVQEVQIPLGQPERTPEKNKPKSPPVSPSSGSVKKAQSISIDGPEELIARKPIPTAEKKPVETRQPIKASTEEAIEVVRSDKPLVGIIKADPKLLERRKADNPKRAIKKLIIKVDNQEQPKESPEKKIEVLDFKEKEDLAEQQVSAQTSPRPSKEASRSSQEDRRSSEQLPANITSQPPEVLAISPKNSQVIEKKDASKPEHKSPRSPPAPFERKCMTATPQPAPSENGSSFPTSPKNDLKNPSIMSSNSRKQLSTQQPEPSYLEASMACEQPVDAEQTAVLPTMEQEETDPRVLEAASAIISGKDYAPLQRLLPQEKDELAFLKRIVEEVFRKGTFKVYLDCIEKLKSINIKFHSAIRPQTIRVLKNAHKAELIFDLTLLYTPDVLYLHDPQATDIDSHNRVIFEKLKPRIRELLNETNIFVVAKLMSVSFNFNKAFEYRVQYYYLEKVIKTFLEQCCDKQYDGKMDLEKIEAMLARLPIGMTAQRFAKMMDPLKGINPAAMLQLLELFKTTVASKKETSEGSKHPEDIQQLEQQMQDMATSLQS